MKTYNVTFTAKGLVKDNCELGTVYRCSDGEYRGEVKATDPDDALHKISEFYRGATVRHCWEQQQWRIA